MTDSSTGSEERPAPSWILELRARLQRGRIRLVGDEPRVVFLVPLFVHEGGLWTILGQDVVNESGELARVSFPAAHAGEDGTEWDTAIDVLDEILGIEAQHALQIGELEEIRALGGLRVLPLVVAIPRPQMAGRTLSATTDAGLALFPLQIMSLLEPQRTEKRQVELPNGTAEVDVITIDDHQLWGPTLDVLERLVAVVAT